MRAWFGVRHRDCGEQDWTHPAPRARFPRRTSYRQLSNELGDGAHARYNAILSRVASFAGAAELDDVRSMVRSGQVEPERLLDLYEGIERELFRFPAVDLPSLRAAVESFIEGLDSAGS